MMSINGVKTNVQALLVNSGLFKDVQSAPQEGETVKFSGYPSVSHYYNGTTSDYATVSQNRRVIEYLVMLYLVTNESDNQIEFTEMYTLADQVIQLFDQSQDLSVTNGTTNLPRACQIMRPAAGELLRVSTTDGVGLEMTIRLYCEDDTTFLA